MNPSFQHFIDCLADEKLQRKRLKVLEQRGEILVSQAKIRSAALGIEDLPMSMCQDDKLKIMSNLINQSKSVFSYKTSIRE
jgi:hypothetical protein